MNMRSRPGRFAAAVGAVVAVGAAGLTVVATGTASAAEPGHCLQNVNVREQPDTASRIVALCEAGTQVKLGESRDGFVELPEMGGWAAMDFVEADERSAAGEEGSGSDGDGDRDGGSDGGSEGADRAQRSDEGHADGDEWRPGDGSGSGSGSGAAEDLDGLLDD